MAETLMSPTNEQAFCALRHTGFKVLSRLACAADLDMSQEELLSLVLPHTKEAARELTKQAIAYIYESRGAGTPVRVHQNYPHTYAEWKERLADLKGE